MGFASRRVMKSLAGLLVSTAMFLLTLGSPVFAQEPGYCLSCHLRGPQYTLGALSWQGPVAGEQEAMCPGLKRAKQELFLTESRMAALSSALFGAKAEGLGVSFCEQELQNLIARLRLVLAEPLHAIQDITGPLTQIRRDLDKLVYRPLLKMEQRRQQKIWAGRAFWGILLVLLAALLGFRRLRRLERAAGRPVGSQGDKPPEPTQASEVPQKAGGEEAP